MSSASLTALPGAPRVEIFPDRPALGQAAAAHVVARLEQTLRAQAQARVIFACAPSQDEFLAALVPAARGRVDWSRVTVFHMDEYVGITATHPASFRHYLREHLLNHITPAAFHPLGGDAADPAAEGRRYSACSTAHLR